LEGGGAGKSILFWALKWPRAKGGPFGPKKVDLDLDAAKEPEMEFLDINFNKRLESFVSCSSQSLLLADFKETILCSSFKNPYKNSARKLEFIHK